jgi:Fe-S-cluster containining protein
MDFHFNCTQCGRCCRNLKLPLTAAEAVAWLAEGHAVQLICEAMPALEEPAVKDPKAAHRHRRSFETLSGSLPTRVIVMLVANLAGQCPNLRTDMRCGIYDRRPLVCRIYPAEISPLVQLEPAKKCCPPEAWTDDQPLIQRDGELIDPRVREDIQRWRDADGSSPRIMRRLCAALQLDTAAVADEGFLVYSPDGTVLSAALAAALRDCDGGTQQPPWRFVTNRAQTLATLVARGARCSLAAEIEDSRFEYLEFQPAASGTVPR